MTIEFPLREDHFAAQGKVTDGSDYADSLAKILNQLAEQVELALFCTGSTASFSGIGSGPQAPLLYFAQTSVIRVSTAFGAGASFDQMQPVPGFGAQPVDRRRLIVYNPNANGSGGSITLAAGGAAPGAFNTTRVLAAGGDAAQFIYERERDLWIRID